MTEVERLVAALDHPTKLARRQAAEALGVAGVEDPAVRARLVAELGVGAATRRWTVAYALFLAGERSECLWPVLSESLGSDDGDLRWAASRLVVALDLPDLTERLLATLRSGGHAQRKMALYCLRERGERSAAAEAGVLVALEDPESPVRLAAMSALAALARDPVRAARTVERRLHDRDPGVRRAAAATLGRFGAALPEVVMSLREAAESEDAALARAARMALRHLGTDGSSAG
jgi:HEAT repeat protein